MKINYLDNLYQEIREDYQGSPLLKDAMSESPFEQFRAWLDEAYQAKIPECNAFALSTVSEGGAASSRMLLLKGLSEVSYIFFTNYKSNKGADLSNNQSCAMLFFWQKLKRQVRIQGTAEKLDRSVAEEYFKTRPKSVQIGAHASEQSSEISSREILLDNFEQVKNQYADQEIPCPEHWGAYQIIPNYFEFWQGLPGRLHDRIVYERSQDNWNMLRLSP